MADATLRTVLGTPLEVMTTDLNSHAHASLKLSSAVTVTSGEEGYMLVWPSILIASFGGTPSANAVFQGWFLKATGGADEYGSASVTPVRPPDFQIDIPAVSGITSQRFWAQGPVMRPRQSHKVLLGNYTGQTTASSGNKLELTPQTYVADEA